MKEEILFDKLPFLDAIQSDRRQQILKYFRNETGLVVKTVSRSIKKMEEEGMISRSQRFILINHEQYLRMKECVDRLICLNDEKGFLSVGKNNVFKS